MQLKYLCLQETDSPKLSPRMLLQMLAPSLLPALLLWVSVVSVPERTLPPRGEGAESSSTTPPAGPMLPPSFLRFSFASIT